MEYNVDYFIKKFEAIPDFRWANNPTLTSPVPERTCALGHCGLTSYDHNEESIALSNLLSLVVDKADSFERVWKLNDGGLGPEDMPYTQPTPKARILAALLDIKAMSTEWRQFRNSDIRVSIDGELAGRKISSGGYPRISYKHKTFRVHEVVWESFNGPVPDGFEINHKNGIKTDCRLMNLELCTHSENMKHAYVNGLHKRPNGPRNPNWKGGVYKKGEYQRDWYHANKAGISVKDYRERIVYVTVDAPVRDLQKKELVEN